ncbi:MAG: transporter [Gammaproteobacteria bacterium]
MKTRNLSLHRIAALALVAVLLVLPDPAAGQSLEPRKFANLPVGMNFLLAGYGRSSGPVLFDPSVPLEDASLETDIAVLGYARGINVFGRSGSVSAAASYVGTRGNALLEGERAYGKNYGLADPTFRASVNLLGAPALSPAEYRSWQHDLIVGVGLLVQAPFGDYERNKVLTIGTNRWLFRPELGMSKVFGRWQLELVGTVSFFTDNDEPRSGDTLSQDPLYAIRGHLIYNFPRGRWLSLDATHYQGGEQEIDGARQAGTQRNGRYGLTLSTPLGPADSVKFYASTGAYARLGGDFDLFGIAWQHRWASR